MQPCKRQVQEIFCLLTMKFSFLRNSSHDGGEIFINFIMILNFYTVLSSYILRVVFNSDAKATEVSANRGDIVLQLNTNQKEFDMTLKFLYQGVRIASQLLIQLNYDGF